MLISDFLPINSRSISTSPTLFYFTPTKKVEASINLYINQTVLTEKDSIQYLGIMLDSNLNWKKQVQSISTKIKRSVGILSKLRYYVNLDILINLYYSLMHPFLIYGLVWGSTYHTNINPLLILQKRSLRIMTFSKFDEHSVHYLNRQTYLSSLTLLNFK